MEPSPTPDLPDSLDKAAITAGVATIHTAACGGRSSLRGNVAVTIKVSAEGRVTAVTVKSSPDDVLASCVGNAVRLGTFAKTRRGGSFSYVWPF